MSGEMRRPPQLWEQKLARTTAILGAGISSSGDATAIVPPAPPPGSGGGTEPAPVAPPAGAFTTPSKPTLFRQVQGLGVLWDGLNADGDLWPYDTSWVEIHADTSGSAFTPSDSTLKGRLARPGIYSIGGLTQGSTYFVRLRGADPAGNYTSAGAAESAITGGTITAVYISGGTMAAGYLSGGTISGGFITGGTINGALITSANVSGYATSNDIANFVTAGQVNGNVTSISGGSITSGTITGIVIRSASAGRRVELNSSGYTHAVVWRDSSGNIAYDMGADPTNILSLFGSGATKIFATNCSIDTSADLKVSGATDLIGALDVETSTAGAASNNRAFRVNTSGQVFSYGIDDNTTASAANVRVEQTGSRQLVRSTSTARLKDQLAPLTDDLAGVDAAKLATFPASIDPYDVLAVTPTEFRSLCAVDADARMFGFIAEDVAAKLPWAANWDDQGLPSAVEDRPILAALLHVVKEQQATISALTARIEALEA